MNTFVIKQNLRMHFPSHFFIHYKNLFQHETIKNYSNVKMPQFPKIYFIISL